MISQNNNADFYIDKINKKEHFSFTRWGDGEWFCAGGVNGSNCDKHQYFPEMSKDLRDALTSNKDYYKAIWPTTHGQIQKNLQHINSIITTNKISIKWANAIVWEDLVIREGINKLITALEGRNFVIVSNSIKRKLPIKYVDFIEVPNVNCYLDKDRIKHQMVEISKKYDDVVFGISASMATNVIVDQLYDIIGDKSTMIDFGSIWDPFTGVISRSYHREYLTTNIND